MDVARNRSRTAISPVVGGRYGEAPPIASHAFLYAADLASADLASLPHGTKPHRRGSDQVPDSAQKAVLLSVERPVDVSLASRRDSVRKDSVAGSVAGGADSAARGTPLPVELMNRPHRVSGPVDHPGNVSVIRRDLSNNEMVSRESIMEMQKARRRSRKSSAGRYTVATYPEGQDPSHILPRQHPPAPPGKQPRPSGPVTAPRTTSDSASSHVDCFGGRSRRRGSTLAAPSLLTRILGLFTFRRGRNYASGAVVPIRQAGPGPGPAPPAALASDGGGGGGSGGGSRGGSGHGMHGARERSRLSQRNPSRMSVQ